MKSIRYSAGYKYQLEDQYRVQLSIRPDKSIFTRYCCLSWDGLLTINYGYAWDEPSGPTFDTPSTLRGSLVHDALYQLIRLELLPASVRVQADEEAYRIWRADGMNPVRARLWRFALNKFAGWAARPESKMVLVAP